MDVDFLDLFYLLNDHWQTLVIVLAVAGVALRLWLLVYYD
jgi:hypothetical protein